MRVYDPLLDVSYFVPMEWLGNESWRGPPPGADGFSVYVLEGVVCDLMLAGWVFRASRLWRTLTRDCRRLIFQRLTTRITWTHLSTHTGRIAVRELLTTSPAGMVRWGFRPKLNYTRRPLRGIQAPFEPARRTGLPGPVDLMREGLEPYGPFDGPLWRPTRSLRDDFGNPFAAFFGPPRDMPDGNFFWVLALLIADVTMHTRSQVVTITIGMHGAGSGRTKASPKRESPRTWPGKRASTREDVVEGNEAGATFHSAALCIP